MHLDNMKRHICKTLQHYTITDVTSQTLGSGVLYLSGPNLIDQIKSSSDVIKITHNKAHRCGIQTSTIFPICKVMRSFA